MSDEAIKARLKAAREELGTLELEGMRAIQSAQRCIARGAPVYGVEIAALEALIAGMRGALDELHGGWSERAASPAPRPLRGLVAVDESPVAAVECFACARAARDGGVCERHPVREAAR